MNAVLRVVSKPLSLLALLTAIHTVGLAIPAAHVVIPALDRVSLLWTFAFVLILIWWMDGDSHRRGVHMPYDFAAFAFFGWPIVIPYYLWRSRGGRGLLFALGLAGMYIVPYLVAAIIYATRTVQLGR
jgi:hypothetical protein